MVERLGGHQRWEWEVRPEKGTFSKWSNVHNGKTSGVEAQAHFPSDGKSNRESEWYKMLSLHVKETIQWNNA